MPEILTFDDLSAKWQQTKDSFPDDAMRLRTRRCISWICRAEREREADEDERVGYCAVRFILMWIAFNAAYADNERVGHSSPGNPPERSVFNEYFRMIVPLDSGRRIYNAVWDNFSGPIRILMKNPFVYGPFWQHHNSQNGSANWRSQFNGSKRSFNYAVRKQQTDRVLAMVFDRLYVLRNQLMHGGTTWNKTKGHQQVKDGAAILDFLVPIFVDLMMDNPNQNWSKPRYPFVNDPRLPLSGA